MNIKKQAPKNVLNVLTHMRTVLLAMQLIAHCAFKTISGNRMQLISILGNKMAQEIPNAFSILVMKVSVQIMISLNVSSLIQLKCPIV